MISKRTILNTLVFFSGVLAIFLDYSESVGYFILKPLTTILVILLPLLGKGVEGKFRHILILALCFCFLGDILLLKEDYFVFGLGAFLIAHLLLARGFMGLNGFQKNISVALVLLTIGVGLYVWLYSDLGPLKYPVAAYVLVILFMAWQGIGLYMQDKTKAHGFIALGVLLFMFSDSMIAVNKFKLSFEYAGLVILSTYWLAIALIANAGVRVLRNENKRD